MAWQTILKACAMFNFMGVFLPPRGRATVEAVVKVEAKQIRPDVVVLNNISDTSKDVVDANKQLTILKPDRSRWVTAWTKICSRPSELSSDFEFNLRPAKHPAHLRADIAHFAYTQVTVVDELATSSYGRAA